MQKTIEELVNFLGLEVGKVYVSTFHSGTFYIYKLCYTDKKGYFFKKKVFNDEYSDFNENMDIASLNTHHLLSLVELNGEKTEPTENKINKLLLELADINPYNVDCVSQCKDVVNTILKANVSEEINKACLKNLKVLSEL